MCIVEPVIWQFYFRSLQIGVYSHTLRFSWSRSWPLTQLSCVWAALTKNILLFYFCWASSSSVWVWPICLCWSINLISFPTSVCLYPHKEQRYRSTLQMKESSWTVILRCRRRLSSSRDAARQLKRTFSILGLLDGIVYYVFTAVRLTAPEMKW